MVAGCWLCFRSAEAVQALVAQRIVLQARYRGCEGKVLQEIGSLQTAVLISSRVGVVMFQIPSIVLLLLQFDMIYPGRVL